MAITIRNVMNNAKKNKCASAIRGALLLLSVSAFYPAVAVADFRINAGASADAVQQNLKSAEQEQRSLSTYTVEPFVTGSYRSKTLQGLWKGKVVYLERDREDSNQEDTYAEYSYNARWAPFERLLMFEANGALTYRNANAGNYLVSDFLTNSQNLRKVRTNRYAGTLQLDQGNYARANGTIAYSNVESERSLTGSGNRLENDTYQANGVLRYGEKATRFFWTLQGSYQQTERGGGENANTQGDFISRRGSATADAILIGDFGLRLNAVHEGNQVSNREDTNSRVREFNSYGAGIVYRQSAVRYIAITANRSDPDIGEEEEFIGGELRWAFSSRSNVAASYGRRFYGDSASASFNYNTKHFRASFGYDEDVTNTSRILANPENLGVFVCPVATTGFSDCFQPASLDYQPGADEQLVELTVPNFEFEDNIIVRKSGNAQIGYSFSRVSIGLSVRYSEDDYIDAQRVRQTYATGLNISYALGSYTNLEANIDYAEIQQQAVSFENGKSENWNASIGLSRRIGRHLTVNVEGSYLEKSGNLTSGSLFGAEYSDRRVSAGITYRFN
ncbi:TIGR03016 family PEP-CTERM system-associated outer membrane protein [Alteromonas halophila]|uniref:TIGR03016 family PEP-CTERM system-associated outer membrane protein n=1 Tax=Alteromonas halophila TaxID=516698 RepID=A0A918JL59_9ALTE|nr:TIGR03016 family PEP-CTERM system-associated outer membrane protein [Alteromonas halophila]GGW87084.1 hypothetical protein GCM10007391_21140 [Alteromonas halophila]